MDAYAMLRDIISDSVSRTNTGQTNKRLWPPTGRFFTYTKTLPQNPFHSEPAPIVSLSPLQSRTLPLLSLLPLLQSPPVSSHRTHRRLLSRRRQATSPTMTTAVASATRPRCLEPWPAVVSSGDCYCRCNAHTHTMPHTVFIFARKRTPPAIYVHVY